MATFADDLLQAAASLLSRRAGQKGPLKSAYVRRSVSTTYYAIFHFCLDEAALRLVGTGGDLRQRRRLFVRTLSHTGLAAAFGKLKGATVDRSVEELFRLPGGVPGRVAVPTFVQQMAAVYIEAKAMREDADYNLSAPLTETDARQLRRLVDLALQAWTRANSQADRDAKHAIALLLSLKGKLRE